MNKTLTGQYVRLEPLTEKHIPKLEKNFSKDLTLYYPRQFESAHEYYDQIVNEMIFGPCFIYAIVEIKSAEVVGCSGFFHEDPEHRKVEIGGSWVGLDFQKSVVNVESKLLLLTEAFESRKYLRVEFMADSLNIKSQKAMEKLGLVQEGLFRNHLLRIDGRRRHSVFYSVIEEEWVETKKKIQARLAEKSKGIA